MRDFIIFLLLYVVVFAFDVVPQIKSQKWKPLWFVLLIYLATFILEALLSFGLIKRNFNEIMKQMVKLIFKVK